MEGMIEKGKKEMEAEQLQFAAFKTFCDSTSADKQKSIEDANDKIEVLTADAQKFTSDAEGLGKEIAQLDEDISTWEGDSKAAVKVREIENIDYTATHKDYSESFLAQDPTVADENLAVGAPEAAAFESQLQGIIDMLEGLAVKFENERTTLEKTESDAVHAFE